MKARILKRTLVIGSATCVLALAAAPAQAAFLTPEYQSTFAGSGDHQIGDASTAAVDSATHTVYVADRANHRISKFDEDGDFIFMIGDGVNETTGADLCPVAPGDICRPGQSNSSFPDFENPTAIAVDNSGGPSKGSLYVGDNASGTVSKFTSAGTLITSWGVNGQLGTAGEFNQGLMSMTVSGSTGYLWVFANYQFFSFDEKGAFSSESIGVPYSTNDANMAVDSQDDLYFQTACCGGEGIKVDLTMLNEEFAIPGPPDPGPGEGLAVNPVNDDLYYNRGNVVRVFPAPCDPTAGYCTAREEFGSGQITGGEGLGVDSGTGAVYVATDTGVAYFKPKIVPDVLPAAPPAAEHTSATVSAHVDPLGAGDVSECKVEFGQTKSYGSSVPCDVTIPVTTAQDVSAEITGLTTESSYHYRFVVENGNGVSKGADQLVTPHWVRNILTADATGIGPGTATLNGSLDPNGESTHYYFEWGPTTAYGNETPSPTGTEISSGPGIAQVQVPLDGLVTSQTTYHYRIVAYNSFGTSVGEDRTFTTPLPVLPQIQGTNATGTELTAAIVGAEVNPGFGDTSYMVQYGTSDDYEARTLISDSVGNDGEFHPVSTELTGLEPGRTFHYRVVAFNFKGTTQGPDQTFTTPSAPSVNSSSASILGPSSVRLTSSVSANGTSGPQSVVFEYGASAGYGSRTAPVTLGAGGGTASVEVSGLTPATTYHFRALASNPFGSAMGTDSTFVTPPAGSPPNPTRPAACKKGQVRKKGKCVKKAKKKRKKKGNRRRGGRG